MRVPCHLVHRWRCLVGQSFRPPKWADLPRYPPAVSHCLIQVAVPLPSGASSSEQDAADRL
eukprot:7853-Eustigmatos_ZCMA.PRE.1